MFFLCVNQLGRVNELHIKPDPTDLTEEKEEQLEEEEKEEDLSEETVEENRLEADCVSASNSFESALNQVTFQISLLKKNLLHCSY